MQRNGDIEGHLSGVKTINCTPKSSGEGVLHECTFSGSRVGDSEEFLVSEIFIEDDVSIDNGGKNLNSDDYFWEFEYDAKCEFNDYPSGSSFRCSVDP